MPEKLSEIIRSIPNPQTTHKFFYVKPSMAVTVDTVGKIPVCPIGGCFIREASIDTVQNLMEVKPGRPFEPIHVPYVSGYTLVDWLIYTQPNTYGCLNEYVSLKKSKQVIPSAASRHRLYDLIISLNDSKFRSFAEIADILERWGY